MFVDLQGFTPREPRPRRERPQLTERESKVLGWIIAFNLVMLFVGPLAGVTMFDVVVALFKH